MAKKHRFETNPPQQEKFPLPGMPGMEGNHKPFDHQDIATQRGIGMVLEKYAETGCYGRPSYDDLDSPNIHKRVGGGGLASDPAKRGY